MEDLSFVNQDNFWIAETEVNDDYNIHIECDSIARISVLQKTSGDKYAEIHTAEGDVFDNDYDGLVYPKTVRIICSVEPSVAIITEA